MNSTKWSALIVLALLTVSIVPAVFAENENDTAMADVQAAIAANANATFRSERDQKKLDQQGYADAREAFKARAEEQRKQLMSKRQEVRANMQNARKDLKAAYNMTREALKGDKERMQQLRTEFKDKRQEIKQQREDERKAMNDLRDNVRKCASETTDECQKTRLEAKGHATAFLNHAVENIIAVLNTARDRVEASDKLTADQKASAGASIDDALVDAAAAKDAASSLSENSTKADIQAVTQMIKGAWGKAKEAIKNSISMAAGARIGGIITQMQHLQDKFDRIIAQLKAKGKDTSSAEAKKADFQAKLAAATDAQQSAQTLFASKDMQGATAKLKEAHADLQAAQDILKGIVQEIRGIGGGKELDSESSASAQESENDTGNDTSEGETA
jgi:hypothetical protein